MTETGEFDPGKFARLPREAQIALCLREAERAQALAEAAAPGHKDAYMGIANQWLTLATDMRRSNGSA